MCQKFNRTISVIVAFFFFHNCAITFHIPSERNDKCDIEFFRLKKQVSKIEEINRLIQLPSGVAMFFGLIVPPSFVIGFVGSATSYGVAKYKVSQIEKDLENYCKK